MAGKVLISTGVNYQAAGAGQANGKINITELEDVKRTYYMEKKSQKMKNLIKSILLCLVCVVCSFTSCTLL